MNPFDYKFLCRLLKERSGLSLADDKQYLVENRLLPVARRLGCGSIGELVRLLKAPGSELVAVEVIEAMMINESFFFRDRLPFDRMRDTVLPALIAGRAKERRIRIWSAAASTGQEPYSIAMMLKGLAGLLAGWQIEIVATDISNDVLEKARAGCYSQFEVQRGLPIHMLMEYFKQTGDQWQISAELKNMVQFRQLNLLDDFFSLGSFDVVFLRNVLIYFDQATKADVLGRLARMVVPDGYLLLGAAETVVGVTEAFVTLSDKRGLYVPKGAERPAARLKVISGARSA